MKGKGFFIALVLLIVVISGVVIYFVAKDKKEEKELLSLNLGYDDEEAEDEDNEDNWLKNTLTACGYGNAAELFAYT